MKLKEKERATTVNVLLYGPPKTGKTTAALSVGGRTLYLNCDEDDALFYGRTLGYDAEELEFSGHSDLLELQALAETGKLDYDTVVIDPIGDLYRILLDERSGAKARPTLNQRGDVVVDLERWCRAMCKAPVNFVMVAHELVVEAEGDGQRTTYRPFTGTSKPTLGNKLAGMVGVVGYTGSMPNEEGELLYVAQLRDGGGRVGGDRFGVIANEKGWAEANLAVWLEKIEAQRHKINDKKKEKSQ